MRERGWRGRERRRERGYYEIERMAWERKDIDDERDITGGGYRISISLRRERLREREDIGYSGREEITGARSCCGKVRRRKGR